MKKHLQTRYLIIAIVLLSVGLTNSIFASDRQENKENVDQNETFRFIGDKDRTEMTAEKFDEFMSNIANGKEVYVENAIINFDIDFTDPDYFTYEEYDDIKDDLSAGDITHYNKRKPDDKDDVKGTLKIIRINNKITIKTL